MTFYLYQFYLRRQWFKKVQVKQAKQWVVRTRDFLDQKITTFAYSVEYYITICKSQNEDPTNITNEISVSRIDSEPSELRCSVLTFELLVEDDLEVCGGDRLLELLEVNVVVDEDAALAERLDLEAIEGVTDQGVPIHFGQL